MVPSSHPRYVSLMTRDKIVAGVEAGVTSIHGLIAPGRGEAFDYLLGERTHDFAHAAIQEAARVLAQAKHPVLSINGNVAALAAEEMMRFGQRPKAALLSHSNFGSANSESARKMRSALALVQQHKPDLECGFEAVVEVKA